jgi:hypothetical protein
MGEHLVGHASHGRASHRGMHLIGTHLTSVNPPGVYLTGISQA